MILLAFCRVPYPALILLGGIQTGKKIIDLVGDVSYADSVIFISMDYPYKGKKKFKGLDIFGSIHKIRSAIFNSVSGIMLILDYLHNRDDIDKEKIFVAGISFGGFSATAAAGIDKRIKAANIVYCGGDIRDLLIRNMIINKDFNNKTLINIVGNFAYLLVRPAEPLFYIDKISPNPVLMINGKDDERVPYSSAIKLFDKAKEPKDIIWFDTEHIHPSKSDITQKITEEILKWYLEKNLI